MRKFSQPPARLLLEQGRVQVAAGAPFVVRDVFQAGGRQHQRGFPIGERADHAGPAPDFPVQALDGVVRADAPPMLAGHLASRQRLGEALVHDLGGLLQLHRLELGGHRLGFGRRGESESESTPAPLTSRFPFRWTGTVLWTSGIELMSALPLIFHGR